MRDRYRLILALALIMLLFGQALPVGAATAIRLRFVYASPDAPAIDIWINGAKLISNLSFFNASLYREYSEFSSGTLHVTTTPTGRSEPILKEEDLTVVSGNVYTIAILGILADLDIAILEDDLTRPVANQAHVRLVHAAPNLATLRMLVAQEKPLTAGPTLAMASGYMPITAKNYDLQIILDDTGAVGLSLPAITFEPGTIYDVFVVGETFSLQSKIFETAFPPIPARLPNTSETDRPIGLLLIIMALIFIATGRALRRTRLRHSGIDQREY